MIKIKKQKSAAILTLICLFAVSVFAPATALGAETTDTDVTSAVTWTEEQDGTVWITGLEDPAFDGILVIPDVIDDKPVSRIDIEAFEGSNIVELVILPGAEAIGPRAFSGCTRLQKVTIPETILTSEVGIDVFHDCAALSDVNLPDTWTSVPAGMFSGCAALEELTVPATLTKISDRAFENCAAFTNITVPDGEELRLTYIGDFSFSGTAVGTVIIDPEVTEYVGICAFADCANITYAFLGGLGQELETGIFMDAALEDAAFASGTFEIPNSTFLRCASLKTVTLPSSVKTIEQDAFSECGQLTRIIFQGTSEDYALINVESGNEAFEQADVEFTDDVYISERDGQLTVEGLRVMAWPRSVSAMETAIGAISGVMPGSVHFASENGEDLSGEDAVGTGTEVIWTDVGTRDELQGTLIMRGDVTGTGILNIAQVVQMARAINGSAELSSAQQLAGDLDGDGAISITDLVTEAEWLADAMIAGDNTEEV